MVVAVLPTVIHLELTSRHLGNTVVHSFTGVDGCLQVGVLQRQHGSAGFDALVASAYVNEDSEVDVGGDGYGLGEDGDSGVELGGVVDCGLGGVSISIGRDAGVDGASDEGFVAGWG